VPSVDASERNWAKSTVSVPASSELAGRGASPRRSGAADRRLAVGAAAIRAGGVTRTPALLLAGCALAVCAPVACARSKDGESPSARAGRTADGGVGPASSPSDRREGGPPGRGAGPRVEEAWTCFEGDVRGSVVASDGAHCTAPAEVLSRAHACLFTSRSGIRSVTGDASTVVGVRYAAFPPGSLFSSCGFRDDDIWLSMNGLPLTSPDRILAAYRSTRAATSLSIDISREGRRLTLHVGVR
jgi:hypothetical protein